MRRYNEEKKSSSGGVSIPTVVMIVFIILKLTGVEPMASWSWAFVIFVPFLVSLAISLLFVFVVVGILGVGAGGGAFSSWMGKRKMQKLMREVGEEEAREAKEKNR